MDGRRFKVNFISQGSVKPTSHRIPRSKVQGEHLHFVNQGVWRKRQVYIEAEYNFNGVASHAKNVENLRIQEYKWSLIRLPSCSFCYMYVSVLIHSLSQWLLRIHIVLEFRLLLKVMLLTIGGKWAGQPVIV